GRCPALTGLSARKPLHGSRIAGHLVSCDVPHPNRNLNFLARRPRVSSVNSTQLGETYAMGNAQCSCGAVTLSLPGPSRLVVACHCIDCQRRTGAPFSVGTFYPADAVTISGTTREYTRTADSGGKVHRHFCPNCG